MIALRTKDEPLPLGTKDFLGQSLNIQKPAPNDMISFEASESIRRYLWYVFVQWHIQGCVRQRDGTVQCMINGRGKGRDDGYLGEMKE